MAQQISFKTENQIYNDFIGLVNATFNVFDISGWQVRQLNQLYKINVLKPTVFLSISNATQRGQQYSKNIKNNSAFLKNYANKSEVTIKFSAARRELPSDDLTTLNSIDVLKIIKNYLQSDLGVKYLANLTYAQYRATEITPPFFVNDDDNFQLLPSFNCTFVYEENWQTPINAITKTQSQIDII